MCLELSVTGAYLMHFVRCRTVSQGIFFATFDADANDYHERATSAVFRAISSDKYIGIINKLSRLEKKYMPFSTFNDLHIARD